MELRASLHGRGLKDTLNIESGGPLILGGTCTGEQNKRLDSRSTYDMGEVPSSSSAKQLLLS